MPDGHRPSPLPQSLAPRGLNRCQAAAYIGVSPTKLDEMIKDGRMPKPKRIDGRTVWDRVMLDESFEALPDEANVLFNPALSATPGPMRHGVGILALPSRAPERSRRSRRVARLMSVAKAKTRTY